MNSPLIAVDFIARIDADKNGKDKIVKSVYSYNVWLEASEYFFFSFLPFHLVIYRRVYLKMSIACRLGWVNEIPFNRGKAGYFT